MTYLEDTYPAVDHDGEERDGNGDGDDREDEPRVHETVGDGRTRSVGEKSGNVPCRKRRRGRSSRAGLCHRNDDRWHPPENDLGQQIERRRKRSRECRCVRAVHGQSIPRKENRGCGSPRGNRVKNSSGIVSTRYCSISARLPLLQTASAYIATGSDFSPSRKAGTGLVGVAIASTDSNARAKSARIKSRTARAFR